MTEPVVRCEVDAQGIALVTLNRPQVLNALSRELLDQLAVTIDELGADPQVRVLILTGAGRAFCAGLDLKEIGAGRGSVGQQAAPVSGDPVAALEHFAGPVIGAINGAAVTGGFELALACDWRIAAHEARIGLPEAGLGLLAAGGGTQRLTHLVGPGVARRLILGAETVGGREAERLGLVQWAVPRAQLADAARALAQRCAANPRTTLAENKRCIALASAAHGDGYAAEIAATRRLYENPETRRRVAAFLDKIVPPSKEQA